MEARTTMRVMPEAVRRQLEQLGYVDVPDEVVLEFLAELKAEAAKLGDQQPHPPSAKPTTVSVH